MGFRGQTGKKTPPFDFSGKRYVWGRNLGFIMAEPPGILIPNKVPVKRFQKKRS